MATKRDSAEAMERMFAQVASEFGAEAAERMVKIMAENLGSLRLVFPDLGDIAVMVRNQQICAEFKGNNYAELAMKHATCPRQIRRIVHAQRAGFVRMTYKRG